MTYRVDNQFHIQYYYKRILENRLLYHSYSNYFTFSQICYTYIWIQLKGGVENQQNHYYTSRTSLVGTGKVNPIV